MARHGVLCPHLRTSEVGVKVVWKLFKEPHNLRNPGSRNSGVLLCPGVISALGGKGWLGANPRISRRQLRERGGLEEIFKVASYETRKLARFVLFVQR